MRAAHALLGATVLSMAFSGCLDLLIGPPEPAAVPEPPAEGWYTLPLPAGPPPSGVLGFWVPENTTGLRIYWEAARPAGVAANTTPDWRDGWPQYGGLHEMPALAVVLDPDGRLLYAGTEAGDVARAVPPVPTAVFPTLYATQDPEPGLYRLALYGRQTPPLVDVHVTSDRWLSPMAPLPLAYDRILLGGAFPGLGANGAIGVSEFQPPIGTVSVTPDFAGGAVDAAITIQNRSGADLAHMRTFVARTPGSSDLILGFDATQITRTTRLEPAHLDAGPWRAQVQSNGDGYAFLYLGIAAEIPAPQPMPATLFGAGAVDARETVRLAGGVEPWAAAWFTVPPEASILLRSESAGQHAPGPFRIYDELGERLLWGLATTESQQLFPPPGLLLLVNDGDASLHVDIVGPAPGDAAFHAARTERMQGSIAFDAATGPETVEAVVTAPGPVLHVTASQYLGYSQELHVTLRKDDSVLASLPTFEDGAPGRDNGCCSMPLFGFQDSSGHFLDGGRYTVRIDATEAQGEMVITLMTVALQGAATSGATA